MRLKFSSRKMEKPFNSLSEQKKRRFKYFFSKQIRPFDSSYNDGIQRAEEILRQREDVEWINIDTLSPEQRYETYSLLWEITKRRRCRVRKVFGTHSRSGNFFGREVPALLDFGEDGSHLIDFAPRREGKRIITIYDYLRAL